ncbi:hypothetical protein RIVM261_078370 [Rivularia sp. IAM M-261]|nr:hypothetical protein RIVM261_078370 [Rivularia sp. IAM M-261]
MPTRIRRKMSPFNLRRNARGKRALSQLESFSCCQQGREKTCTTARNYIRDNNIQPPCIITVTKKSGKNDKFLLSNTGLFEYRYAVANHKILLPEVTTASQ